MIELTRTTKLGLLLGITLLGAFLRLYQLHALPPGDGYDVAQYGVDALQILQGARPIFLPTNFGREVLFSYLVALIYLFTGPGAFGIHLASALVGIATIPAVYLAAGELLVNEKLLVRTWGPLLAALITAVSYWHLNYSRVGLRVIWVPLFAALIAFCLWRGLRRNNRWLLATAGALLGLSLYTYQAARLLPLLAVLPFVLQAVARRRFTRADWLNGVLVAGVALLVFAPLGWYAWQHPDIFNDRVRQAALFSGEQSPAQQVGAVWQQSLVTLRMFGIEGDQEPLFTIPGRPSLNPFLFFAFVGGILLSLWRWKRPRFFYLLAWLALLTAPAMVADMAATGKRALGAFPAVAILAALALVMPLQWLLERRPAAENGRSPRWRAALPAATVLIAAGLLYTAVATARDYFVVWGTDPSLPGHFQRDHLEIGRYIGQLPRSETVLVSPFPVSHPSIQLHSGLHPDMRSYDGHACMIYPAPHASGTTYVIAPGPAERSLTRLATHFPQGELVVGPQRPDRDAPYFHAYRVPPGARPEIAPPETAVANWNDEIRLLGYDVSATRVAPGDRITLTLTYEATTAVATDYTAFVHLLGAPRPDGNPLWGQADSEPCRGALPTGAWRAGDIVSDTITLRVAEDAAPGAYDLATGFYTWPEIVRVPLVDETGRPVSDAVVLQTIVVE